MTEITIRDGLRADGLPYQSFRTRHVYCGNMMIGAIQCRGPCFTSGIPVPWHHHGPWKAFVGPTSDDSRNLPGWHETEGDAVAAILAEVGR